ncbi:5-(carboxyamino)imidazole ribonucleotide synthase [Streptomyces sp. NBC_01221]|uniref:5-(carboxyamino)imidazole ribonucleotide synthase n=1 Tax=unclassified Streptomyces TaxID=2593676 RepID=UPI002252EF9F|nr:MULTISPECIES: 5-(carboxyamino)imidazole ribonucleotide synthase [unclassified Streptomyces]WSP55460.1 5-(carboxyamino)imidazole ribonucleotide synthase [Streptomyces sp. NBC_01241]WSU23810.1 5-(carboxyamino)imidazole ribonucleotide synthase [Streptomyces sp. NBC_01108]MCX4787143.1 5-(carboxyamino)imidazole ribonucleotide synthase [Streptomyces sp. NBC_01221]MCX4797074.1 5-(carboxyamino)imidazole ribonucleotide synthase [Streptomyces sp. NBC_01242]WSJ38376.1 5-(carboxyamino)imidazole ribonuc
MSWRASSGDRRGARYPGGVTFPVVGMVGGGQLARMTHEAGIPLGIKFKLLSDTPQDSAAQVVNEVVIGDYRDLDTLRAFARGCDVITFDHEHVPTEHLRALEADGIPVRPGPDALVHAQDKGVMRAKLTEIGAPCPRHRIVRDPADVAAFAAEGGGFPVVLKTVRGGYDGKGVWVVRSEADAADPFRAGVPVLAEEKVDFVRELAADIVRSPHGQAVAYPVVESIQVDGVCDTVIAPAPELDERLAGEAQQLALRIAAELGVVGHLAVELFETRGPDGEPGILINELAMRPHNSGHWTQDGAITSQFANHVRAVLDLPLGDPRPRATWTVMSNVLGGDYPDMYQAYLHCMARDPQLKIHMYGKDVKPGRKVGHVNTYGDDLADVRERARHAADYLRGTITE